MILTEKMLCRIAVLFCKGKTPAQIAGVMTLEFGTIERRFTEKIIRKELIKMEFDPDKTLTFEDQ